jgi:predicted nucleic acid-binding protein
MTVGGQISGERADDARSDFEELALVRYPHQPLSDRVWELRRDLSAYDATFVALAEALAARLLPATHDLHPRRAIPRTSSSSRPDPSRLSSR